MIGDFDPSGEGIKNNVLDYMSWLCPDAIVEDITVTHEQAERFELEHVPDDSEYEKMQRDPNFRKWTYGRYRVETAALRIQEPDYFDNLIRHCADKYIFDEEVYKQVQQEQKEERDKIKEMVEDVLAEPE